jgi:hypothetical protein
MDDEGSEVRKWQRAKVRAMYRAVRNDFEHEHPAETIRWRSQRARKSRREVRS